tara:strand:+ start:5547 stop:5783 length:237 start_codon:yes stop_codon:yes gene_type:complete
MPNNMKKAGMTYGKGGSKKYQKGGEKRKIANKVNCEGYKNHMMYDSKTGKSKMTKSCQEHLDLSAKGWGHDKPKKKKK